jgi:hypothetical protein
VVDGAIPKRSREPLIKRHDRLRKLANITGGQATRRGFDELRLVVMGLDMVDYVRVAASSGCPVATRLMTRWDECAR